MKGKLKSWIIAIIIIIILLIPIVVDYYNNKTIKVISYDKYQSLVSGNDFALVYFGDINDKSYTSTKETLVKMQQNFEINVKSLDNTKLTSEEKKELSSVNENLTKDYGNGHGIFDVSLEIEKGEIYGFVGVNGAGKTTTSASVIKALG